MMNAFSLSGNRTRSFVPLYVILIVCLAQTLVVYLASAQQVQAQTGASLYKELDDAMSQEVRERIVRTITSIREQKLNNLSAAKSDQASKRALGGDPGAGFITQADLMYTNTYFDTEPGLSFTFPEDAHDYCRAYFNSDVPVADPYLDIVVNPGSDLSIELRWSTGAEVTDYDVYLFDRDGKTVGDATGVFPEGENGISYQFDGDELVEVASVQYGGTEDEVIWVAIDRFRGPGENALELSGAILNGGYNVLEYTLEDVFGYYDAVSDERLGSLEDNASIDISLFSSPSPELALVFETDDCAESVEYIVTNVGNGEVINTSIDNDEIYSVFGGTADDLLGESLENGVYQLTATPYSEDNAQGAMGPPLSISFEVTGAVAGAAVTRFELVDPATNTILQEINDDDVIDLTTLTPEINIVAILEDSEGIATGVELTADVNGVSDALSRSDNEASYSLYTQTDGTEAALNPDSDGSTVPVGTYELTASPIAGPGITDDQLTSLTIQFEVLGPRIENYTLIDADTDIEVFDLSGNPVFDPIPVGAEISIALPFPQNLNIRANPVDFPSIAIGFVDFSMTGSDGGPVTSINERESFRPYALFGDFKNELKDFDPPYPDGLPGYSSWGDVCNDTYTLVGTPSTDSGISYPPTTLTFSITDGPACSGGQAPPGQAPESAQLLPNFPNPFNPVTTIQFGVPETMFVKLVVYDMTGREVKRLVNDTLTAGFYNVSFDAGALSSGMYMYRLETPDSVQYRLMTLLK